MLGIEGYLLSVMAQSQRVIGNLQLEGLTKDMVKASAKIAAGAAFTMAALMLPAAAAHAAPAPYALAAAAVASNGTLIDGKNIVSTRRKELGAYCVRVSDEVDLSKAYIQVTANTFNTMVAAYRPPTPLCGNAADTILVRSTGSSGSFRDAGFHLTVT
jgi:hypothetical protein